MATLTLEALIDIVADDEVITSDIEVEVRKIPSLYTKYWKLASKITTLSIAANERFDKLLSEHIEYYTGQAPRKIYLERPLKEVLNFRDAKAKALLDLSKEKQYIDSIATMLKFIESSIASLKDRGYNLKTVTEYRKLKAGQIQ